MEGMQTIETTPVSYNIPISCQRRSLSKYSKMMDDLRTVFLTGKTKTYEWRISQLNNMLKMLKENEEVLKTALKSDLNKSGYESVIFEFSLIYKDLVHAIENLHVWMKPTKVEKDLMTYMDTCYILPEPYGTVLLISPWNYPVQLTFTPLIGAIVAGNCVVVKPSEISSETSKVCSQLIEKYLDPKCIRVVQGGAEDTQLLLEEKFDLIMYTGSTAVGRLIMQAATKYLTPVILELGGKSPVIVDENCDFDVVANRLMWGKCINSGQTCIAPDYVLCTKETQPKLLESMKKSLHTFFGEDPKKSDSYCRMINSKHFERVKTLMERSGRVAIGGTLDEKERYIEPTVLTDVRLTDPIMNEEIFGPVLPIVNIDTIDEAIRIINDREKPLTLYVFSKNQKVIDKVMYSTSSGSFLSNDTIVVITLLSLPFGGIGASGMGAYHGKFSFDSFSHKRAVMHKSLTMESVNELRYPPFTPKKVNWLMKLFVRTVPRKRWFPTLSTIAMVALLAVAIFMGTKRAGWF